MQSIEINGRIYVGLDISDPRKAWSYPAEWELVPVVAQVRQPDHTGVKINLC